MYAQFQSSLLAATIITGLVTAAPLPAKADASLTGSISEVYIPEGLAEEASKLTDAAYEKDETAQTVEEMVKKFSTKSHKAVVVGKEFAYAMVPYRGFGPSKYGSQVLLEQVKKVNTLAGAEYLKQRTMDELHAKVVCNLLQISQGLDSNDKEESKRLLDQAQTNLTDLVGKEKAAEVVRLMTGWSKSLNIPATAFAKKPLDVGALQHDVRTATGIAVSNDPVFKTVAKKLQKYNRGKLMSAVGSVVESTAAVTAFLAPGMLIPLGIELANAGFVTGTGGCEETKLVNELFYAKRMESRWKRLNEETQLAITSYQTALEHKSPTMLACSESFIQQLVGAENSKKLLGDLVLPPQEIASDHASEVAPVSADKDTAETDSQTELASQPSSTGDKDLDRALAETDELWADAEKAEKAAQQDNEADRTKSSKHKHASDKNSHKSAASLDTKYE